MISKILETLYSKVFINIISAQTSSTVYVEVVSRGEVSTSLSKSFQTKTINAKMLEFVKLYTEESPFHYITILDKSDKQGFLPTCKDISKYTDEEFIKTICVEKKYSLYTKADSLKDIKYDYQSIGVDFIFSPFSILNRFFKDKINNDLAIFLLLEENHISLSIFNKSKLLYAEYLDMKENSFESDMLMDTILDEDDDMSLNLDDVNLDDIDADEGIDSLEDFSNIEDLDSGMDIEEFSEAEEVVESQVDDEPIDNINEDYKRFILIQDAISAFYHDERFDSEFVEKIYIADSINISKDLKKYLEEEIFLNVVVRKISLQEELCDMAKMELK